MYKSCGTKLASLKEEIAEIIRPRYFPNEYKLVEGMVNEIISRIEKRIDELLQDPNICPKCTGSGLDALKDELK
jgi:hypothetical protein